MPPSKKEISELNRLAAGIIRAQGNRFIKELLREKQIRIGATKDDFERNLNEAIEKGSLTLEDVSTWLAGVEGWGDQHVYVYRIVPSLRAELNRAHLRARVRKVGLDSVWESATVLTFPREPTLVSIAFTDDALRIVWQESSPDVARVTDKDYMEEDGIDTIEYRAYRQTEHRAVTRFVARTDLGLAALFVPNPIQGTEHQATVAEALRVIGQLIDLPVLLKGTLHVPTVSRNLDQKVMTTRDGRAAQVKSHRSRLSSGGAYVEFAAYGTDREYLEEPAISEVRQSVRTQQLSAFQGAEGEFIFQPDGAVLTRPLRVQLHAKGNRVRLWAQMSAPEVWSILAKLSSYA